MTEGNITLLEMKYQIVTNLCKTILKLEQIGSDTYFLSLAKFFWGLQLFTLKSLKVDTKQCKSVRIFAPKMDTDSHCGR